MSGRIEALGREREALEIRVSEMEALATQQELSDSEFDILRDMLTSFAQSIDGLGLDQQRVAVKTLVRKVVWDGEKAHMILFGAEGDVDLEGILSLDEEHEEMSENTGESDENLLQWGPDRK